MKIMITLQFNVMEMISQINLVLWLSFSVFLNVKFVYVVVWLEQILSKKFLKFDGPELE